MWAACDDMEGFDSLFVAWAGFVAGGLGRVLKEKELM
jgi:hypothetical protein